jgi:addiction module HigA family antidote
MERRKVLNSSTTIERNAVKTIIPKNGRIVSEKQAPIHPGRILLEEFLEPHGITQTYLADHIGVSIVAVNNIIRGKQGITPRFAMLLGDAFGNGPEMWFNMQRNYDFCLERDALRRKGKVKLVKKIPVLDKEPVGA